MSKKTLKVKPWRTGPDLTQQAQQIIQKPIKDIDGDDYRILRQWFGHMVASPATNPAGNNNFHTLQVMCLVALVKITDHFARFSHSEPQQEFKPAASEVGQPSLRQAESGPIKNLLAQHPEEWAHLAGNKGFKSRLREFLKRELQAQKP